MANLDRDMAFYELIRHVAYAETWIRHLESFEAAMDSMGLRWCWKTNALYQGETLIPRPENFGALKPGARWQSARWQSE
jgi:hypothetical protein